MIHIIFHDLNEINKEEEQEEKGEKKQVLDEQPNIYEVKVNYNSLNCF